MPKRLAPPAKFKMPGWSANWPAEALKGQLALLGPRAFERGFRQKPSSSGDLMFPNFHEGSTYEYGIDWRSISDPDSPSWDPGHPYWVSPDWGRYIGCDLAGKKRRGTVIFVLAISPEGVRHILDIRLGAWTGPEFVRNLQAVDDNLLLRPRIIFVENNALQESAVEWIKELAVPCWSKVRGFRTGTNKMDPEIGLPSIDVQYSTNRWRLGIPHRRHQPTEPDPKDPTHCICGRCTFIFAAESFTKDDLDQTPDTIAAQFIAKEASRQGERFTPSSVAVIKISGEEIRKQVHRAAAEHRSNPYRINVPSRHVGTQLWGGSKVKRDDFGRF